MRKYVKERGWRAALPNSPDVKNVVIATDSILAKVKSKKLIKSWSTGYAIDEGVYLVHITVRYGDGSIKKTKITVDIYKPVDNKLMNCVVDFHRLE